MDKYEEALERAREIYNAPVATIVTRTFLEQIFPELKVSEDERIINRIISYLKQDIEEYPERKERIDEMLAYLKKRKEQKPAEWNEEDDELVEDLIKLAKYYSDTEDETEFKPHISWLKALPERFNSRPHWKPSEEQMQYLLAVINDPNNTGAESCHLILESLYNDLKKLM